MRARGEFSQKLPPRASHWRLRRCFSNTVAGAIGTITVDWSKTVVATGAACVTVCANAMYSTTGVGSANETASAVEKFSTTVTAGDEETCNPTGIGWTNSQPQEAPRPERQEKERRCWRLFDVLNHAGAVKTDNMKTKDQRRIGTKDNKKERSPARVSACRGRSL